MNSEHRKANVLKAFAVTAIVLMAATVPHMIVEETEESDGLPILLPLAFMAIGFGAGAALGYYYGDLPEPDDSNGDQEEVNGVLRQQEAEKVSMAGESVRVFVDTILPADAELWAHTLQHWNYSAELAVMQLWEYGQKYDPNLALEISNMRKNIEHYMYDWQAALDNFYTHTLISHIQKWLDADPDREHLNAMTASLTWDTGSADLYTAVMDFCTLISGTAVGSTVYIDASTEVDSGTFKQDTSGTLYKLSSENVTLRNAATGQKITLTTTKTDLSAAKYDGTSTKIASGLYYIETAGATLAGPLSKAADAAAVDVVGTMVFTNASSATWFTSEDGTTKVNTSSGKTSTSKLYLQFGYIDRYGNEATKETYLLGTRANNNDDPVTNAANMITNWNSLIARMDYNIDRAAVAGETLWLIYDYCEESVPYLSPSSISTTVDGVSLNAVQSAAVYILKMEQIYHAWQAYGETLTESLDISWTPESLSLYMLGDIYYNGTLYAENAVFTPYNSLSAVTFREGATTYWSGSGYVMVWGGAETAAGWTGPTNTSEFQNIPMSAQYSIDVKEVWSYGERINEATISPVTISKGTVDPSPTPDPATPPQITSNEKLVRTIAYLMAAILILLGAVIAFRGMFAFGSVLIIAGIILALIGYYDPGIIARIL